MVDFGTRDFGAFEALAATGLSLGSCSSLSLPFIQPRFSPFSKPAMSVDDSLFSTPFHLVFYRRALFLPPPPSDAPSPILHINRIFPSSRYRYNKEEGKEWGRERKTREKKKKKKKKTPTPAPPCRDAKARWRPIIYDRRRNLYRSLARAR